MVGYSNSLGQLDSADYYRQLERRVARLERGTTGAPSTDVTVIASLAITGLTLSTQTVTTDLDGYQVMMRYSWTAVPNDPSEYNKDALDGYLTSWSLNGTNWTSELFTTDTFTDVGRFAQSQSVTFRVRARTVKGTLGNFSSITNSTTADATAPFQPATPVVSPYLGQLAIDWTGLDVSSNPMPTDFRFCEVHLSTTSATFTPTTATLVGTILLGGGTWVATGLPYGTLQYARLVAVDTVGNRSTASTAGSGTPVQAANGDISALSVGKLTAGVITAVMTISGRLATALTGVRAEMNSSGFQAFDGSGNNTFNVDATTGNMLATGQFRTALAGSGVQYLDMTSTSDRTTINFYDTTGSNPAFMNTPADGSGNPRVGINTGAFTYNSVSSKHRLFLNNAGGIQLESYRVPGGNSEGGRVVTTNVGASVRVMSNGTLLSGYFTDSSVGGGFDGFWQNDRANGGLSALFCSSFTFTSAAVASVSYGSTMSGLMRVLYSVYSTSSSADVFNRLSAMSGTGFSVTWQGTVTSAVLNYWAFRTT
jgi:hypothetical protein